MDEDSTACEFPYGYSWFTLIIHIIVIHIIGIPLACVLGGVLLYSLVFILPFIDVHGIPVPRLLVVVIIGLGVPWLVGYCIVLLARYYRLARMRGRVILGNGAIALGGVRLPFSSITAVLVLGSDKSSIPLLIPLLRQKIPTRHLHLRIYTGLWGRAGDAHLWLWHALLPKHAFDQVVRTLARECPRAALSIPGLSDPANPDTPSAVSRRRERPRYRHVSNGYLRRLAVMIAPWILPFIGIGIVGKYCYDEKGKPIDGPGPTLANLLGAILFGGGLGWLKYRSLFRSHAEQGSSGGDNSGNLIGHMDWSKSLRVEKEILVKLAVCGVIAVLITVLILWLTSL
jgi:hypothetical protein